MAQRRYGPTRGAGVAVIELEGDKTIEPGALGMAAYGGILERGPVGELIMALNKKSFSSKCGGLIPDSLLPDSCHDYYDLAAGAGGLFLVRVTDGNELPAELMLYARRSSLTPMGKVKAHNGGRWGGKAAKYTGDMPTDVATDLDETTLNTGVATWKTDQWKGGSLQLEGVPNKTYPIVGNTAAGVVSVASDQTMLTDIGAGVEVRFYLFLENEDKMISVEIGDGEEKATEEFALTCYVDGVLMKKWPNLSTDPDSPRYWVDLINEDGSNYWIEVEDLWTGAHVASVRPATVYGVIDTVTATVLTPEISEFNPASVGDGDGTSALGVTTDAMVAQKITVTFSDPTTFTAVSDKFGALGGGTVAALFTPNNVWTPPFTLTAGGTAWEAADEAVLVYKPLVPGALVNGFVYPDKVNASRERYRIVENDHSSITAADGSDLTASGAPTDEFMVTGALELAGGRDGVADLADADYTQQLFDVGASPFLQLFGKNLGLVKFAVPGNTASAVQKAGVAFCEAKNYQFRYEIPAATTSEEGADAYVNDTLGRNDFAVVSFPSYCSVADPEATEPGKLKVVSMTGMIHGREARIAANYSGYHKAEAGIDAILPRVLKIPTGDVILNEEYLNPLGINVVKKVKGNFILWGDRTLYLDPAWKWKHQRELLSYYEHVLQENFDWIVFAINDATTQKLALTALKAFFIPEFNKRAIRGEDADDAARIKIDDENNTTLTMANGDMNAEIKLRLADTVERFIISIGKQGIFESVG
jgi:hypothetical protein